MEEQLAVKGLRVWAHPRDQQGSQLKNARTLHGNRLTCVSYSISPGGRHLIQHTSRACRVLSWDEAYCQTPSKRHPLCLAPSLSGPPRKELLPTSDILILWLPSRDTLRSSGSGAQQGFYAQGSHKTVTKGEEFLNSQPPPPQGIQHKAMVSKEPGLSMKGL